MYWSIAVACLMQMIFRKTECRRNKFTMIDMLHQNKVPAAEQIKLSDWETLQEWLRGRQFPIVIKPIDSAGSDGVFVCKDLAQCQHAFAQLKGQKNRMGLVNQFVLAQEFLRGTEYVVNTVTLDGKPLLTELVEYKKQILDNGSVVYDTDKLLPSDAPVAKELFAYILKVHKALGIVNGPAHAEVMFTATGPKLVEIAARTDGILRPDVSAKTTGLGQLSAVVLSIIDPKQFFERCDARHYQLKNYAYNVCLISPAHGKFNSTKFREKIMALSSYYDADLDADGSEVKETRDVFSQPGTVYLIHPTSQALELDCVAIRRLEASHCYLQSNLNEELSYHHLCASIKNGTDIIYNHEVTLYGVDGSRKRS